MTYAFGENAWVAKKLPFLSSMNAFSSARMSAMISNDDLDWIASEGFDHIRVPIEPYVFGFKRDDPTFTPDTINQPFNDNYDALYDLLDRANERGLKVIIDMHPTVTSNASFETESPWHWPGITKKDLMWCPGTVSDSSPLVLVWDHFVSVLEASGRIGNPKMIAFEVFNEPMVSFDHDSLGISELDFSTGAGNAQLHWRELQRRAINKIQAKFPDYTVIATNTTSQVAKLLAFTYVTTTTSTSIPAFTKYTSSEVLDKSNVGYALHIYEPFRYTHWVKLTPPFPIGAWTDGDCWFWKYYTRNYDHSPTLDLTYEHVDPKYRYVRDYMGEPLLPDPVPDPEGLGFPGDTRGPMQSDRALAIVLDQLNQWRYVNQMPAVYITEFGTHRRDSVTLEGSDIGNDDAVGDRVVDWDAIVRAQWLYDVRYHCANAGLGWTVYNYIGGFGVRRGAIHNWANGATDYMHPGSRGPWYPLADVGLFGTRPAGEAP